MRFPLVISTLLHVGVIGWSLFTIATTRELPKPDIVPINVELLTVSELDNLRAGDDKAKQKEPEPPKEEKEPEPVKEVEAPKPKKVAAIEPPKPEPTPEPEKSEPAPTKEEPKAEAEPAPVPAPKPNPRPKRAETPKPKTVAKAKPKPKKKSFDPDQISALLNKIPDAAPAPRTAARSDAPKPKDQPKPRLGAAGGQGTGLSISEKLALAMAIRRQVSACWTPPTGGQQADALSVRVRFDLREDGSLLGTPQVLDQQPSPYFLAAADSATRAVWQCQPYNLPRDLYQHWKSVTVNFDPREMFGN